MATGRKDEEQDTIEPVDIPTVATPARSGYDQNTGTFTP